MKGALFAAALGLAGVAVCACSKSRGGSAAPAADGVTAIAARPIDCGHAACGDGFFVDVEPTNCVVGAPCTVGLKLVATGDFHINDEYPYRFRADAAAGVEFAGTDSAGKNVFSKSAGDWRRADPKTGLMTVKLKPTDPGKRTVEGTFKLSVCSERTCLLEQRQVSASVIVAGG